MFNKDLEVHTVMKVCFVFNNQQMEEEKPWALISEVGGDQGYLEELANIVKQHFRVICYKDFLQNPELHGSKIQALLCWKYFPAAEPPLLTLLPSLKVVASGGVGVDHLDIPFINSLGVKVANTPNVVSDSTADLAMGLLLASARKILNGEIEGWRMRRVFICQSNLFSLHFVFNTLKCTLDYENRQQIGTLENCNTVATA